MDDDPEVEARAATWLRTHKVKPTWLLRHAEAPWNIKLRVSALSIASYEGNVEMVQWLFKKGCGEPHVNRLAPMRLAAQRGHINVLKALYDVCGPDQITLPELPFPGAQKLAPKKYTNANAVGGIKVKKTKGRLKDPSGADSWAGWEVLDGAFAAVAPFIPGDTLLHVAARSGQLESLKYLWETLETRQKICLEFKIMKKGDTMGKLPGPLSFRLRNPETGDELIHAAAVSGDVGTVEFIVRGLASEDQAKTVAEENAAVKEERRSSRRASKLAAAFVDPVVQPKVSHPPRAYQVFHLLYPQLCCKAQRRWGAAMSWGAAVVGVGVGSGAAAVAAKREAEKESVVHSSHR